MDVFAGSAAARALYYYRTGDVLDIQTLQRLRRLSDKANFGEKGRSTPCDRLIMDLRRKAAAGELDYMVVYADGNDCGKSLGATNTVSTTHVTGCGGGQTAAVQGQEALGSTFICVTCITVTPLSITVIVICHFCYLYYRNTNPPSPQAQSTPGSLPQSGRRISLNRNRKCF